MVNRPPILCGPEEVNAAFYYEFGLSITRIRMRTHTCSSFNRGGTQLFITNRYFLRTRAHTHMPMRIGPRTHIGSSDTDYGGGGGGGIPVVCVRFTTS